MIRAGPLIERELREEARRSSHFWLRILASGSLLLVFVSVVFFGDFRSSQLGRSLFAYLQRTMLFAFWVIVPLITADCIAREKREGTLGLLLLTPLSLTDVVLGKAAVHALRALTLFLAALPILGLPYVLGGVSYLWGLAAVIRLAETATLGIAAGIFASTRSVTENQARVKALGCALVLWLASSLCISVPAMIMSSQVAGISVATWIAISGAGTALLCFVVFRMSLTQLVKTWAEAPAAEEQPKWTAQFAHSQFWQEFFHWDTSATLSRNPIAWLQEYSWTARLTKWGLLVAAIFGELIVLSLVTHRAPPKAQIFMTFAFALALGFGAVGSFRRETETGVLELLLVTPLSVGQLLGGRIWGLFCHYLPALAVLIVGWTGDRMLNPAGHKGIWMQAAFPNPFGFAATAMLGLYLSMTRVNFALAGVLAWLFGFAVPLLLVSPAVTLGSQLMSTPFYVEVAVQSAVVFCVWLLIRHRMRTRGFVAQPATAN